VPAASCRSGAGARRTVSSSTASCVKSESWVSFRVIQGITQLVTHYNGQHGQFIAVQPRDLPRLTSTWAAGCHGTGCATKRWHRVLDQATRTHNKRRSRVGYAFIHSAIDAHSRLAYSEIRSSENARDSVDFLTNAHRFFADHGIQIERVLTDNGPAYRSLLWACQCRELELRAKRTKPYHPATKRQNRTLQPHPARRVGLRPPIRLRP
jgi:hypothetical protein